VTLVAESRGPLTVHCFADLRSAGVDAFMTDRFGGVSDGPYDSLNLGDHVGDDVNCVQENRGRVATAAGVATDRLAIISQAHGTSVVDADLSWRGETGDVIVSTSSDRAVAILVADCVPLLVVAPRSRRFAVVHAGWRGLAGHVLGAAISSLRDDPGELVVGVGPAISAESYQVGPDVATHFTHIDGAVRPDVKDRSRLDLYAVVAAQLADHGVAATNIVAARERTDGGELFFSDRAQRPCGRCALVAKWSS
jgi:polyphenol oxidase